MLGFSRPAALFAIALIPLFFALRRAGLLRKFDFPLTLGDWGGRPFRWRSPAYAFASFLSVATASIGFAAVCCALAGPVLYRREEVYTGAGTAVMFVLDVSPSMAARDIGAGSRLDAARKSIRAFAERRGGDSFGLVALGSDAALLVPPTIDRDAFFSRLDSLKVGELGDGTALGMGIAVAAAHLVGAKNARSWIVLLTDGENNTGSINPKTAASILPENDIGLFVAGIGTKGEVPLEYTDPSTGRRYTGVLQSEFNETALRDIATRGLGRYISAGNRDLLDALFKEIGSTVPAAHAAWTRSVEDPLELPFILCSLGLFAFTWVVRRIGMGAIV